MKQQLKAFIQRVNGKMVAVASDETQDRHGDVLRVQDWDLKSFKKNPVLLWAHDYGMPPVGIAKNIKKEEKQLTFEPVFHEHTQPAREIKKLFDEGIMNSFSVGYIDHQEGEGKSRLELLEISAVPVPANPSAIVIEKGMKEMTEEDKNKIKEWIVTEQKQEGEMADTVSEELDEQQKREEKWKLMRQVDMVMSAFWKVYMSSETEVKKFGELLKEAAAILVGLAETSEVKAGKSLNDFSGTVFKEFVAEEKAGRVLSKKNRVTIESAKTALQEVLDADTQDENKDDKNVEDGIILKIEEEKTTSNQNNKGRSQELIVEKTLEALNNQIGYITRKIKNIK